jgi:serine/threonine protein kinase
MPEDSLIGRQLGNFRIERLLGRGGMALVYYGWDVKLERPVAIKVIDARYQDSPAYAARFVREARTVATWRHENIIQIHYADEQDELYYFVMEYVDGLDLGGLLSQYAREGELMPHDDVLRMGRAIASALDYAHQKGVIHRDVKPSNVMIAGDGRVVLTDFGLAMDVQIGTLGEAFGSPHYIAPEQARRSTDAVPQSDLYSLGVILYEMLTGVVPFDDLSPTSVALQHLTQPPPPPREINPNLSEETEAVLLKALSKSPDERYQTGAGLLDALEAALQTSQPAPVEPGELPPLPAGVPRSAARSLSFPGMSVDEKVASHLQASAKPASPRHSSSPAKGSLLGRKLDEYRLEALLGKGGMAGVYRGLDVRLKRYVAIKVIDSPLRSDSEYVVRFEHEARAFAQLEHPHIVRLYRYGEADGLLYMAMQYIDGADLGTVLANYREDQEFIEPEEASRIIREICLALDYVHSQGVIHRDIKPSNIMLDKQGRAILTDFGLALLTELGTRGEIFGSPHYIAPEQVISSANVVPQSDLYAVGVILYEMFTGELLFDVENPLDIAMLHMTEPPRPPRELRPDISPEVEAVILKALAKEPEERYQSGAELADALDRALQIVPAETPATPRATAPRLSVLERVAVELADRPLPPIPAAIAVPAPQRAEAEAAPTPTTSTSPRKRWFVYTSLGIAACLFLAVLLAAVSWLSSGNGKEKVIGPTSTAGASIGVTENTATATATADNDVATKSPQARTPTSTPPQVKTSTPTPPQVKTSTPMPLYEEPVSYSLLIAKRGEESLFVVNQTTEAFPLALLRLSNERGQVSGTDWGVDSLAADACVAAWRDERDPKPPNDVNCDPAGERLAYSKENLLWKEAFNVYYGEQLVGICDKNQNECVVSIPTQPSYYLLVARRADEGLFIINWTTEALPLAPLRLGNDKGAVDGTEWGIAMLEKDVCVAVWKDKGEPKPPDGLICNQVGENLPRRDKEEVFWKSAFGVYYDGEMIGTCEKEQKKCIVHFPLQ